MFSSVTVVYCNNVSAVYVASNPVQHCRMKHIEIDIHFIREKASIGQVRVLHILSSCQLADVMIKGLSTQVFQGFRSSLTVQPHDSTTGAFTAQGSLREIAHGLVD